MVPPPTSAPTTLTTCHPGTTTPCHPLLPAQDVLPLLRGFIKRGGGVGFAVDRLSERVIKGRLAFAVAGVGGGIRDAAGHLLGKSLQDGVQIEDVRVFEQRLTRWEH